MEDTIVSSNTSKVASGHLIKLKCKAGVTQSLLPSTVEMNEAVVDSVLTNISCKLSEWLQANGIGPEQPLATEISEIIEITVILFVLFTLYILPKFNDPSSLCNGCKYNNCNLAI